MSVYMNHVYNIYDTHLLPSQYRNSELFDRETNHESGKICRLLNGSYLGSLFVDLLVASTRASAGMVKSMVSCIFVKKEPTAVANHRPPPNWNQLKWPPQLVVQRTV